MSQEKKYDTVVGLEVHIQLNTQTKAFCGDALSFGDAPNIHTSAISLAHPGSLPVVNKVQISKAVKLGLALGCRINKYNFFDRKHYFYPDSPKAYQITQDNEPICIGGSLDITVGGVKKTIRIHHIHMEEDAGKTVHDINPKYSLVDLNRAGTPLMELVTEPDLSSGEEVYQFMTEMQKLLRYIDVSDADMEKGSMRCDCNVSVKPAGSPTLGERCEIKNLNSRRYAREAVEYEAVRQVKMVEAGISFTKQTLHYNVEKKITQSLRDKEGAEDYRYFPDPDLPPTTLSDEYINEIKSSMPALPWEVKATLVNEHQLVDDQAEQITQDPDLVKLYFSLNETIKDPKTVSAFLVNQLLPSLSSAEIELINSPISVDTMSQYMMLIKDGKVTASVANQRLWPVVLEQPTIAVESLADQLGILINHDEGFIDKIIAEVIAESPNQVKQFKGGKKNLMGFFVGAIMRKSKGSADPKTIQKKLMEALS